jgi:hypothetical protein
MMAQIYANQVALSNETMMILNQVVKQKLMQLTPMDLQYMKNTILEGGENWDKRFPQFSGTFWMGCVAYYIAQNRILEVF